jgi:alpha-galactosidase
MTKITFIGAGSTVFAKNLMGDILSYRELQDATIALFDVDPHRLALSHRVGERIAATLGAHPTFEVTSDRERALDGADYAINMIQVGGYEPSTVIDFEIPKRFGLRQTIADTLGIGGIMRGLRTVPVLLSMAHDMERLCPDVLHLNYVNPMAINCLGLNRGSRIRTVGLCHSVPHTASELAADIGVPVEEIDYLVAGINHVAFYLKFARNGVDLTPDIRRVAEEGRMPAHNRVRYEMFRRLGYFVTESSEHFAEYVPWFIKQGRDDLIERFNIPLDEYVYRCQAGLRSWDYIERELLEPGSTDPEALRAVLEATPLMPTMIEGTVAGVRSLGEVRRSSEYGSTIIHAIETNTPKVIYGNVANHGLIDDLPAGCTVEVPCLVDAQGVQPTRIGRIPPHLAALMQTHVNVQTLVVEAILTGNREHVYHAAMLDPHTGSELDLDQIWALVDALIEAHGEYIPAALR